MKTAERKVPYICRDCGHTQHQTEIVMPDGSFYVGGSANWCEMCGNGLPVRQAPPEATPADLEVYDAIALGLSKPEHIGEVVVGEEGFTKGWTVVRWRADLPPIPVGTKLYTAPQPATPKCFTKAQRRRLYDNSPEIHHVTFSIFSEVLDLVERAHSLEEA